MQLLRDEELVQVNRRSAGAAGVRAAILMMMKSRRWMQREMKHFVTQPSRQIVIAPDWRNGCATLLPTA